MEVGFLTFNVELNRVTPSAQCFSMLFWNVPFGSGRENVDIHGITADKYQLRTWFDPARPFRPCFVGDDWSLVMRTIASWPTIKCSQKQNIHNKTAGSPSACWSVAWFGACSWWRVFTQVSWQIHPWELETTWPYGMIASHDKRSGRILQTPDFSYKHTVIDESRIWKHQRIAAQNVTINVCWVRINGEDWSETVRRMNHRISVAWEPFPISPLTEQLAKRQCQIAAKVAAEQSWISRSGHWTTTNQWQFNFWY